MGAAAWTRSAEDITEDPTRWGAFLTVRQLSDAIELAPATIMDALTRSPLDADPRSAIYRPAARIGQTALAAVPMWKPEQRDEYLKLAKARGKANTVARKRKTAGGSTGLPVYDVATATEKGLASTEDLADLTGYAENTLRRFARENGSYPPEVGIAQRVPPYQFGPPRTLRNVAAVKAWLAAKEAADAASKVASHDSTAA